jgi:hypothetical protein
MVILYICTGHMAGGGNFVHIQEVAGSKSFYIFKSGSVADFKGSM